MNFRIMQKLCFFLKISLATSLWGSPLAKNQNYPCFGNEIVCAWTNRVRHLGCTTTNRVESAHAVFKRWLGDSKGDLCRGWDTVNQMLQNQHNEIQTSFGRSKTVMEHRSGDHRFETAISIG